MLNFIVFDNDIGSTIYHHYYDNRLNKKNVVLVIGKMNVV